ncbi:unnamed protein product [Urochloa humidicola]
MEATTPRLARSASLSANRLRRSRTARFPPSPHLCPLSSSPSPPSLLPLRRARSDADLASFSTRSAVLLRHAPIPAILEADDEGDSSYDSKAVVDGAGAGRNGAAGGGSGGRGGGSGGGSQGSGCDMGEYYRRVLLLEANCIGGERDCNFSSPLSSEANCLFALPPLLEGNASPTVARGEAKMGLPRFVGVSLSHQGKFCLSRSQLRGGWAPLNSQEQPHLARTPATRERGGLVNPIQPTCSHNCAAPDRK